MKNLLSLLATLGLIAATRVIACGSPKNSLIQLVQSLGYKTDLKVMEVTQQWLPGLNGGTEVKHSMMPNWIVTIIIGQEK